MKRALALISAPLTLAACATVPVADGEALSARLERDIGASPFWARDATAEEQTRDQVAAILARPLSADAAVQIALLNNPRVTAAFEGLGVARADFMDAALPSPPFLHFMELRPQDGDPNVLKYGIGFDLSRLVTLPAALGSAEGAREAARAEATAELLGVASQARGAWIDYAQARQIADLMAQAAETADAAAAAADALLAAGNIAQVERDREALFAAEIGIANAQAQAALVPAHEKLIAALALRPEQAQLLISLERLPPPPNTPIARQDLESRVIGASTDLAVAMGALQAARADQSISWLTSLLPGLAAESERERDDGGWKEGFGLSWMAPLFDLGGADRLRRASTERRATALAEALDLELRAEARTRLAQAEAARQIALTRRTVILPLSADVFDGAVRDFNAMEIGILQLLQERRARLEAGRATIAATADYWRAQAALDLLLAGARRTEAAPLSAPAAGARAPDPGH
ncbi:MAG: TolC family protein [Alphaproteobacteria bacterium]|nr:TolC family protein [Alphaproteobacteria bacterium]